MSAIFTADQEAAHDQAAEEEAEWQRMAALEGVTLLPIGPERAYPGPSKGAGHDAYTHYYAKPGEGVRLRYTGGPEYKIDREKSEGCVFVDVPALLPVDVFDGISREEYDAYVSRVKVSKGGVVTARKVARKVKAVKRCPHCGGTV